MYKIKISLLSFILFCGISNLLSQDFIRISLKSDLEPFQAHSDSKFLLKIDNLSKDYLVILDSIVCVNPHFGLKANSLVNPVNISTFSSYYPEIIINSEHNLNYNLSLYVYYTIPHLKQSFAESHSFKVDFLYNDLYDEFAHNKIDLLLKNSLKNYVANHTSYSYKDARTYMFSSFDNVDGWVECVYTGEKIQTSGIPDVNTTHFNNEHTWPQAKGADIEPPKSDLYHMYPTYEPANTKRGDYPFGNVVSNVSWEMGGSKLGNDKDGNIRFEPRDVHKGNVARSLFYFAIRYNNPYKWLNTQEKTLREWMDIDPVDAREMKRNDNIAGVQGKRNPFIDHPEFVKRIYSISTDSTFPAIPMTYIPFQKVNVSTFFLEKDYKFKYFITNNGNVDITINLVSFTNPSNDGLIKDVSNINNQLLPVDSTIEINVNLFENLVSKIQKSNLIITLNQGINYEIPFEEVYYNSIVEQSNNEISIIFNPFSESILFKGLNSISGKLLNYSIFDLIGNEIQQGNLTPLSNQLDLKLSLINGIYFIKIINNNQQIILPFKVIR